jgi:Zn-dependent M28 family amino/carboxypeptidase
VSLSVSADQIGAHLDALMQIANANGGIRADGTPGYDASVAYVASQLEAMGYDVQQQPFDFTYFNEAAPVTLSVGGSSWTGPEWMHAMLYSPPGDVSGPVHAISIGADGYANGTAGCDAADWAGFPQGGIALIESAPCPRSQVMALAQAVGAVGAIALYPGWDANETRRPILPESGVTIPAIAVGAEPAAALLTAAREGGSAEFQVQVETHATTIDNVIAEWPGATPDTIMLGGHLDSVLDGPGIDDNGSGVATLLSMAASVAVNPQPAQTIRFGLWGAEENGFLGSHAYVSSLDPTQIGQIGAYLNLDMVASPGGERIVYNDPGAPPGSAQLSQQLLDALLAAGTPGLPEDESRESDHESFAAVGVPIGGVFSGINDMNKIEVAAFGGTVGQPADPCYHMPCDTRANINLDSAVTLGDAAATVLANLAY